MDTEILRDSGQSDVRGLNILSFNEMDTEILRDSGDGSDILASRLIVK